MLFDYLFDYIHIRSSNRLMKITIAYTKIYSIDLYKQTIVGCCHPELMFDIINTIRMVRTPNIFIHGSELSCLFSQGITVVDPSFWCLIVQVSNCLGVYNCPVSNCLEWCLTVRCLIV